ncbi:hypothetical protein ERO13_D03G077900v2 [Gossypium hirsutum]|nr:hypothetical protein ERO13_D03G077900v2 [Gossypium hirsutum]
MKESLSTSSLLIFRSKHIFIAMVQANSAAKR